MCEKLKHTLNFRAQVRENELSARKTTHIRLTFGIQRTKNIVRISYGTYLTARANRDAGRDAKKEPRLATRSCVEIRLSALDTKYTILSQFLHKCELSVSERTPEQRI